MKDKLFSAITKKTLVSVMVLVMVFTLIPMIPNAPIGGAVEEAEADEVNPLCFTSVGTTSTIRLFKSLNGGQLVRLKYCTGSNGPDGNWKEYSTWYQTGTLNAQGEDDASKLPVYSEKVDYNKSDVNAAAGEVLSIGPGVSLYLMATGSNERFGDDTSIYQNYLVRNIYKFKMEGAIEVSGDITSLLSTNSNVTVPAGCFARFFEDCESIISAESLSLPSNVSRYCYHSMFNNCTKLVTAPNLPAETMADNCYTYMFGNCSSLAAAPVLSSTSLAPGCYAGMFSNCTSLKTAPELPADILKDGCYSSMFSGCTGIATPPSLTATTLAKDCYSGMFSGCTQLSTAPKLPCMQLEEKCYDSMFSGCTGLLSAPELPATTLAVKCYMNMFLNCKGLLSAPELPAKVMKNSCYWGMFSGCVSLSNAPKLPATILAYGCYYEMFSHCTSLTIAPALPATTLAEKCYMSMFYDSGLTYLPKIKANSFTTECCSQMFWNCKNLRILTEGTNPALTVLSGADYDRMHYIVMFLNVPSSNYEPGVNSTVESNGTPTPGSIFYTLPGLYSEEPEEAQTTSIYFPDPYVKADDGTLMPESKVYAYNEALHQAEVAQIQNDFHNISIIVRTKLGKKGIKAAAYLNGRGEELMDSIRRNNYTATFDWYRSLKPNKGYKYIYSTDDNTYYNTSVKKNTTYYYKCIITIYDKDGQILHTLLSDCTYGYRTFKK